MEKLLKKAKAILGSIRFWVVTLTFLSAFLADVEKSGFDWLLVWETLRNWGTAVAAIGTADKLILKK